MSQVPVDRPTLPGQTPDDRRSPRERVDYVEPGATAAPGTRDAGDRWADPSRAASTVASDPADRPRLLNESPTLTRVHYVIFAMAFFGWMFDFYDLFLYTFLMHAIRGELGLTREHAGWALGASLAATAVGGVFFGILADKIGRKPVLIATILTFA